MRTDQLMGLSPAAWKFLGTNEVPNKRCPTCQRPMPVVYEVCGSFIGMFGERYPLHRRILKDGRVAEEFLQADPWSSGPCFFIGLRVGSEEFLWDQKEIDNC